jgi:phosphate starvation-inducible protein PhoH and related proteins
MSEKLISADVFDAVEFFGVNDTNLVQLKNLFPKLKIVARGENLKLIGDDDEINAFEQFFLSLTSLYEKNGRLTEQDIQMAFRGESSMEGNGNAPEILVHGRNGLMIRARTPNQERLVESYKKHDLIFAVGPAGTGKTYTAVALAVRALKNKEVRRIILTRPAVEAGENLGFLPGDLKDKLDPYLQPLYDALWDMLPAQKLTSLIEDNVIEIAPLAFMRGRTLDHAFVILDEAQNATIAQMKMFLTRMGRSARFIITGDVTQVDLPRNQSSGLTHAVSLLSGMEGIDIIELDHRDIIRHKLVTEIIRAYSVAENERKETNK